MSDNHTTFGEPPRPHFFMTFNNWVQKAKPVYSVIETALNERANEDWVVTIVGKVQFN